MVSAKVEKLQREATHRGWRLGLAHDAEEAEGSFDVCVCFCFLIPSLEFRIADWQACIHYYSLDRDPITALHTLHPPYLNHL